MKKLLLLVIMLTGLVSNAQNDKAYVEQLTTDFVNSLEKRGINDYFYLNKYCVGTTEMFKLKDGSMCISKGTYYEVYIFWKEGTEAMIKKIDNCGLHFSINLKDATILDYVDSNHNTLAKGLVKTYAVKNPENRPVKSSKVHPCHRLFQFNIEKKSFGQAYNLYDLTNESKFENLNFDYNNQLEIVALDKMIEEAILSISTSFRRQF